MDVATIDAIVAKFPEIKGSLIGILHEIQNHFRYLPEEELRYVSKKTGIPITQIYSIVKFYNRFSLKPKGKNEVCVCLGTACHVKNANNLLEKAKRDLNLSDEVMTTKDLNFTVEKVRCLGCCSLAPVVLINEDTYGSLTQEKMSKILKKYA